MKKVLVSLVLGLGLGSCGSVTERVTVTEKVTVTERLPPYQWQSEDCKILNAELLEIAESIGTMNEEFKRKEALYLHYCK